MVQRAPQAIGSLIPRDLCDGIAPAKVGFAIDSPLEEARFEPSVPLRLGAFTRSKTSMSGPVWVGGFEEREFEGDSPTEEVTAQIRLGGANPVQLRAQEIDEAAETRIVVPNTPAPMSGRCGWKPGIRPALSDVASVEQ